MDPVRGGSQREWTCQSGNECTQLFSSDNDKGIGTCVPRKQSATPNTLASQVGDALQQGTVASKSWGHDTYTRHFPNEVHGDDDTVIQDTALPPNPPRGNSYYGAHQEYHKGDLDWRNKVLLRDARTGGFPSGMLRLSECLALPGHATCGLIASTGFNDCIAKLGSNDEVDHQKYTIDICFTNFTSYAGLRACDAGSPCRDDYICVKPMGYTPGTANDAYATRLKTLQTSKFFPAVNDGHAYDPQQLYGQAMPDPNWVQRNDQRGLCIPPYFVFQFRADGHPGPSGQLSAPGH
jgi:hypothetical protein